MYVKKKKRDRDLQSLSGDIPDQDQEILKDHSL